MRNCDRSWNPVFVLHPLIRGKDSANSCSLIHWLDLYVEDVEALHCNVSIFLLGGMTSAMKVVIQRVTASQVSVDGKVIGKIGRGLNLLVGIADSDTEADLDWMSKKCLSLRLFPEKAGGRFDCSVQDIQGELLVISQFTLYGDCRKGRRPSFDEAAAPNQAQARYHQFVDILRQSGLRVETGLFGAMMQVSIENDGPVTLLLER